MVRSTLFDVLEDLMSRDIRGSKPVGWEYWGKRKGSWCVDRRTSHKMERMQLKEQLYLDIIEGLSEFKNDCYSHVSYYDDLFGNSDVEVIHNIITDIDCVYVNEVYVCSVSYIDELYAFSYHCGISYTSYDDLVIKYNDWQKDNLRWSFLP